MSKCRCGKEISFYAKKCQSCHLKTLNDFQRGINSPNYIDGRTNNKYYCKDCNKLLIDIYSVRCKKCAAKERMKYRNMKDKHHPKYIDGRTKKIYYCKICKKQIHWQTAIKGLHYCKSCWQLGQNNPNYIDGTSNMYPLKFSNNLKEQIRKRDNYQCQLCEIKQKKYNRKLDIHHIDYNKENCNTNNLIALCSKCNIKVNYNRDYWYAYFRYIMENKC